MKLMGKCIDIKVWAFFVNCLSAFYQLFINFLSTFYQLVINFLSTLYQLFIGFISLLLTVYQLFINFINFWTTVYQPFISLIELMNAHCLSPVFATAGASRCRAPPSSMVAATTKDYACIWKDKQCVCANSGTYAKSKSLLLESGSSQTWGTQPRSSIFTENQAQRDVAIVACLAQWKHGHP